MKKKYKHHSALHIRTIYEIPTFERQSRWSFNNGGVYIFINKQNDIKDKIWLLYYFYVHCNSLFISEKMLLLIFFNYPTLKQSVWHNTLNSLRFHWHILQSKFRSLIWRDYFFLIINFTQQYNFYLMIRFLYYDSYLTNYERWTSYFKCFVCGLNMTRN